MNARNVNARPESNKVLVERLLPSTNDDPTDRATAWSEWYGNGGRSSVMAFIRAQNNTPELDADILQEAVITAYAEVERGRYEPRDGIPFAAYVKGIARIKIREARRRARRLVPLNDAAEFEDDRPQLETVVERHEQRDSLRTGLSELPPDRRQVLEGYLKGHTTAEIAQVLGMSEESVRQHKSRGLRSLRRMEILAAHL
ncbi:MAG: sigma-70 family RNA polymerase sigma factor [Anaerolineae bacterium]|nr:sigma-70 family RNA polymerase sigma factor [Anaerolineae bacterium]